MDRAEDAGRGAVEVNRDDRRRPPFENPLHPALKGLSRAGAGDLALGEDANQMAFVEGLARLAKRPENLLRPAASRDRDRFHRAEKHTQDRPLEEIGVDHEPYGTIDAGEE